VALAGHEGRAEIEVGLERVVSRAAQGDVGGAVIASKPEGSEVMELQPLARRAAPSLAVAKGAPLLVADPDRALDRVRDPARRRRRVGLLGRLARRLRAREASPLELADQQRHRAVEHRTEIAIRDLMAQQRPRPLDLAVKVRAGRELHPVPRWRDGRHHVRPASRPRRDERG
jgi:hypothetical protein